MPFATTYNSPILDEIGELFKKYVRNGGELEGDDQRLFQEVIELLHLPQRVTARAIENVGQTRMVRKLLTL